MDPKAMETAMLLVIEALGYGGYGYYKSYGFGDSRLWI